MGRNTGEMVGGSGAWKEQEETCGKGITGVVLIYNILEKNVKIAHKMGVYDVTAK